MYIFYSTSVYYTLYRKEKESKAKIKNIKNAKISNIDFN